MSKLTYYFDQVRDDLISSFLGATPDPEALLHIKMKIDALDSVRENIERVIFAGNLAKFELEE
jgi:hypothetical protein